MDECNISIDVEASGPIPGEYSMLSIGACVIGEKERQFYAEIKPLNGMYVKKALEVCRLSMEELKLNGEEPAAAMKRFAAWVRSVSNGKHPTFCSFGTFDWMFVKWYLAKFAGEGLFGPNGCDMKSYYAGMMGVGFGEARKRYIKKAFKISGRHTHNALDDALEQAELFEMFLRFNKNKQRTI
jgi:DNA polymerase III epsilon subunit-like protein